MKIAQEKFLDFLGKTDTRFAIPIFQRVYSWTARQCEELWDDVMRAAKTGEPHFMGMVLYSADVDSGKGGDQLDVIDGQQRMTTMSLLLVALRAYLDETASEIGGMNGDALAARFLRTGSGAQAACKLTLSQMDRPTLAFLVEVGDEPEEPAQRLIDNSLLFAGKMREPGFDLEALWKGLCELEIASVLLEPEDNPQLVFESLNSKGMPLSTADRVRNLLISSTFGDEQERLHQLWISLEDTLADASEEGQDPYTVTDILHAWLAERYRSVRIFDQSEIYGVFKRSLRDDFGGSFEKLLADVSEYCRRYLADESFREEAAASAAEWAAGKPEKLISEFKMFGD